MSEQAAKAAPRPRRAALKSALFFGVLAGVVGVFFYLSGLEHPPDTPADDAHRLRFNTAGALVGLASEAEPGAPAVAPAAGLELDKKAVERRVNGKCAACHAALSQGHPPKDTCIKCHRMPGQS